MGFIILLILTAFAVASSAAFFSVYGLAQIFPSAFIPHTIVVMGISLELGKLVAASYLYRFWKISPKLLKMYLPIAIIILMIITSVGIFGFLTASYQIDSIGLKQQETTISLYEDQQTSYRTRLDGINKQIGEIDPSYVSKRIELISKFEAEKTEILSKLVDLDNQLLELKTTVLNTEAKIGPIIYVARVLDRNPDDAVFWFVLLIIGVFDPLAVGLTLAANVAIRHRNDNKSGINAQLVSSDEPMADIDEGESNIVHEDDPVIDVKPDVIDEPTLSETFENEILTLKKLIRDSDNTEVISKLYGVVEQLNGEIKKNNVRTNLGNIARK